MSDSDEEILFLATVVEQKKKYKYNTIGISENIKFGYTRLIRKDPRKK